MTVKNRVITTLLIFVCLPPIAFVVLGWWSANGAKSTVGIEAGQLRACGSAPNCVCSEVLKDGDDNHFVAPMDLAAGDAAAQWQIIRQAVTDLGATIVEEDDNYLHATSTSKVFKFVDDL